MGPLDYKVLAAKERKRRDSTFPEWYFKLPDPSADVLDMTPLPEKSGILSDTDIAITNADATAVVQAIRVKKWTCVQVMEAFCKRAVLAQKYVSRTPRSLLTRDQLLDGTHVRTRDSPSEIPRFPL
jgi:amidase